MLLEVHAGVLATSGVSLGMTLLGASDAILSFSLSKYSHAIVRQERGSHEDCLRSPICPILLGDNTGHGLTSDNNSLAEWLECMTLLEGFAYLGSSLGLAGQRWGSPCSWPAAGCRCGLHPRWRGCSSG